MVMGCARVYRVELWLRLGFELRQCVGCVAGWGLLVVVDDVGWVERSNSSSGGVRKLEWYCGAGNLEWCCMSTFEVTVFVLVSEG